MKGSFGHFSAPRFTQPVKPLAFLALLLACLPSATIASHAAMVGINFASGHTGQTESLSVSAIVGVVPQGNWNNVTGNVGTQANVAGPMAGSLVDDSGIATSMSLSFSSTNSWATSTGALTGNAELLNGYLDNTNTATPTTITLAGIPFAAYDLYVYVGSDTNNRTGHVTLTGNSTVYFKTTAAPFDGAFTQATGTSTVDANAAEYVKFSGLSGAGQSLAVGRDGGNVGVYAVQVVEVPEPSSVILTFFYGAAGLLVWQRRRRW